MGSFSYQKYYRKESETVTRGGDIFYTLVLKNIELDQIAKARVTIEQNRGNRTGDDIEVTKNGAVTYDEDGVATEVEGSEVHFDYENNAVTFSLEQIETYAFDSGTAEVQLKLTTIYGNVIPTLINTIRVNPVLNTEVLR